MYALYPNAIINVFVYFIHFFLLLLLLLCLEFFCSYCSWVWLDLCAVMVFYFLVRMAYFLSLWIKNF